MTDESADGEVINFRVWPKQNRAEQLFPAEGWKDLEQPDWIAMPGGNFLTVNCEHAWVCRIQGFAAGILACLCGIGILAALTIAGLHGCS